MTKTDLHNIPGVQELPKHPPLVAVVTYLRANHPRTQAGSAAHWEGWFDALDAIEAACKPEPTAQQQAAKAHPYTQFKPEPKPEAKK